MHRIVRGLIWARACDRPSSIPLGRPRGKKRRGLSYESALAAHLVFARHGQWFEFEDMNGRGHCQVDLLCESPQPSELMSKGLYSSIGRGRIVDILEAKYSWVPEAHSQIDSLYRPVVEKALGVKALGIVVCKNLSGDIPSNVRVVGSYYEAHEEAYKGHSVVWHWLGIQIRQARSGTRTRRSAKVLRSRELGL